MGWDVTDLCPAQWSAFIQISSKVPSLTDGQIQAVVHNGLC